MKTLITLLILLSGCVTPPVDPAQPSPSPSPSASPAATPVPSATPFPKPGGSSQLPQGSYTCYDRNDSRHPQSFKVPLRNAINLYKAEHLEQFKDGNGNITDCIQNKKNFTAYYYGVVNNLIEQEGLDSMVDNCGRDDGYICGEITIKNKGVKLGDGFSDGYQPLWSHGCIPIESQRFRGRCEPNWWLP